MKQVCNFRLNEQTISVLGVLQKRLHCSKTAIVERAIQTFARKKMPRHHKLFTFAGILSECEGDAMLNLIKTEKHNKEMDFDL